MRISRHRRRASRIRIRRRRAASVLEFERVAHELEAELAGVAVEDEEAVAHAGFGRKRVALERAARGLEGRAGSRERGVRECGARVDRE